MSACVTCTSKSRGRRAYQATVVSSGLVRLGYMQCRSRHPGVPRTRVWRRKKMYIKPLDHRKFTVKYAPKILIHRGVLSICFTDFIPGPAWLYRVRKGNQVTEPMVAKRCFHHKKEP
ncbi:hypothetical protein YC2023_026604 [Brassica napus]